MKLDDRGMARREFRRITRSSLKSAYVETDGFRGYAGLLSIYETDGQWRVKAPDGEAVIADAGYTWLQAAPDTGDWWLTVMYDVEGRLVQFYFDIVDSVYISDSGEPRFRDLFLDIVMQPDGSYVTLDMDELDAALLRGEISREQHAAACRRAEKLVSEIEGREEYWSALCDTIIAKLKTASVLL